MSTAAITPSDPKIVSWVASCSRWGCLSLPSNLVGLAGQVAQVANIGVSQLPWVGIVIAPISFHGVVQKVRVRWKRAFKEKAVADKIFWALQGINSFGKAVSRSIAPLMGSLGLAGFRTTGTAAFIFQKVFPVVMLGTSALGLITAVWALTKRVKNYKTNQLPTADKVKAFYDEKKNQEAFKRLYLLHDLSLDSLPDTQEGHQKLLRELKIGLYFNSTKHICTIVASALALSASILMLVSSQYQIISASLMISSIGTELITLIVKNTLMYKSRSMLTLEACRPKVL